jgi:bacterioferritin-associated ferredoxin
MIVCSCNVFSDQQIYSALSKTAQRMRMSQVYDCLGSTVQCGRCAHTIKRMMSSKLRSGVSVISSGGLVIDSRQPADLVIARSADRSLASALPETGD